MTDEALAADAAVSEPSISESSEQEHVSIDDALTNAFDAIEGEGEAAETPAETQAEENAGEPTGEQERGADGRFKAKDDKADTPTEKPAEPTETTATDEQEATPAETKGFDAPDRFSPDAKAAWKDAPTAVQAEINRAITELETGISGYKEKFAPYEGLDTYVDLAKQHGTNIKTALDNYTNLERTIKDNPMAGLQQVAEYAGLNLRDVAAHIMGQTPDQVASQQSTEVRGLKNEIAELKQQLTGVVETQTTQAQNQIYREVTAFAAENPRFDELSGIIDQLLTPNQQGQAMAPDLPTAYEMAVRLNPAPTPPAPVQAETPKPDLSAQTRKGSLSIAGAPASGSTPTGRNPSPSTEEALDRAFAETGLYTS